MHPSLRWSVVLMLACSGGGKTDDHIVPLDGDADTDTDADSDTDADTDADTDVTELCPALPAPTGATTSVPAGDGLADAVAAASPGTTLLLEDGTHTVSGPLVLDKALTLRSASGDRAAVVVDGGSTGAELVRITASGVTLASLTLAHSHDDLVLVTPGGGADLADVELYDLSLLDPGHYGVVVRDDGAGHYVEGGELACSSLLLTPDGRDAVVGQCDTGGLDAYGVRSWVVRDSTFDGLWCDRDPAGPAIRFTRGSREVQVYRNVLADVSQGIVLGETRDQLGRLWDDQPCGQTSYLQAVDASAWNNVVFANDSDLVASDDGMVTGIAAESSCNVSILHNSIYSGNLPDGGSIRQRYTTTSGMVANNLMSHALLRLDGAGADVSTNVENAPFDTWWFPADRDFHTAPGASWAIDQGDPAHTVPDDVDGEPRDDGAPDVGADER